MEAQAPDAQEQGDAHEDPYLYGGSEDPNGYRAHRSARYREARTAEAQPCACASAEAEGAAQEYKDSGNAAYGAKDYLGAAGLYTLALEALPRAAPTCLGAALPAAAAAPEGGGAGEGGEALGEGGAGAGAGGGSSASPPPPQPLPEPTATEVLRATCHCNRAACHVALQQWEEALWDCDRALELKPAYAKAHARRAVAFEHLSMLDEALADLQAAVTHDPASAQQLARDEERVRKLVGERDEKLKVRGVYSPWAPIRPCAPYPPLTPQCPRLPPPPAQAQNEMFGKLKDLGNSLLGKFGMSLDNFKAVKDPQTGSYSISFNQ